jgi:hypothetical protein
MAQLDSRGRPERRYDRIVTTAHTTYIERFCRQAETRSDEFQDVMPALLDRKAWIVAGAILRMQMESLSRTIFLLNDTPNDRSWRAGRSFEKDMDGKFPRLPPQSGTVPDTEMARLADSKVPGLQGSGLNIYKLGSRLVHLSSAHDYRYLDPYQDMTAQERRQTILDPLSAVWGHIDITTASSFTEVMAYASPRALRKLTELLNIAVTRLRNDEGLDPAIGVPRFR